MKNFLVAFLVVTLAACCTQKPNPQTTPVMSDAAGLDLSSKAVCAHLASLPEGCSTGQDPNCVETFDKVTADRLTVLPFACWTLAQHVSEAQACGVKVCGDTAPAAASPKASAR